MRGFTAGKCMAFWPARQSLVTARVDWAQKAVELRHVPYRRRLCQVGLDG